MRRILLVMALLMMVQGVAALGSPIKDTFQDYTAATGPTCQGNWCFATPNIAISSPSTTGEVVITQNGVYTGSLTNIDSMLFTYAAWTTRYISGNAGRTWIIFRNSSGIQIGSTIETGYHGVGGTSIRTEVIVSDGVAYIYENNVQVASTAVTTNPAYITISDQYSSSSPSVYYIDDVVVGYESDPVIIGVIPSDWFIKYDATSPASTGLYQMNVSDASMPILRNGNYYGVTYGRSVNTTTTLQVIDPAGNVVDSYPVANMSGQFELPIENLKSDGAIRNGLWRVSLADDAETSYFWVMGSGASGAWSQESYAQGDTATFSYTILDSSWNTGTSTYRFDTFDVYGNVVDTQTINTQTGSKTVTTDSTDYPSGVYYGAVIQTTSGEDTWLAADAMEVSGYVRFTGYTHDGEAEAALAGVNISIVQGSTVDNILSGFDGNYSSSAATAFGTGAAVYINVTKSGYEQYVTSFVPMSAKTIHLNFTMRNLTLTYTGMELDGIMRDDVYGRPIPTYNVSITNTTFGESYSSAGNSVGFFMVDETDGVHLTANRCYLVEVDKTGYASNSTLKCVRAL